MTYKDIVLADNPSIYFEFDEASGTPVNLGSETLGNITIGSNVTQGVSGKRGSAVYFPDSGSDYSISIADNSGKYTNFTFECWVKSTGWYQTTKYYAMRKGNANLLISYYGKAAVSYKGMETSEAGYSLWDGEWHHIVATFTPTNIAIYVDGLQTTSRAVSGTADTSGDLIIGATPFNGSIDDLAVYDRVLTEGEILQHYNQWKHKIIGTYAAGTTAATTNHPVTLPNGIQSGDYALVAITTNSSTPVPNVPAPFTQIGSTLVSSSSRLLLFGAPVDSSHSGQTFTWSGSSQFSGRAAIVVRPANEGIHAYVGSQDAYGTAANIPAITTTNPDTLHIGIMGRIFGSTASFWNHPADWTELIDLRSGSTSTRITLGLAVKEFSGPAGTFAAESGSLTTSAYKNSFRVTFGDGDVPTVTAFRGWGIPAY